MAAIAMTTDRSFPPLRLDTNHVQPELVLLDHTVDAAITRLARDLSLTGYPTVAHRHEQPNNYRLEERWGAGFELREEILGGRLPKRLVSGVD